MIAIGWGAFIGLIVGVIVDEVGYHLTRRRAARILDRELDQLGATRCDDRLLEAVGAARHTVTLLRPTRRPYDWQQEGL
jgi:serine/threonine protein kinase HipA of HipAB toxin-antitoxin module